MDKSDYTDDIANQILQKLSEGQSIQKILDSSSEYPCSSTFYNWLSIIPGFRERYNAARESQLLQQLAQVQQEIEELQTTFVVSETERGTTYGQASAAVARLDLKIKLLQWLASITRPARYGKSAAGQFKLDANAPALEQTKQLLTAVASGELSPADANAVKSVVQTKAEFDEIKELQERILKLEKQKDAE